MKKRFKIALSMGCPRGIGPEIAVAAASKLGKDIDITIYGSRNILNKASKLRCVTQELNIHDIDLKNRITTHTTEKEAGMLSFEFLDAAAKNVVAGHHDALVTCPINKHYWKEAGITHIGHTEYLSAITNTTQYAMMMASPGLKVTIATIHEAVRDISKKLTSEKIVTAARLTHSTLVKYFRIERPRIAITALNPHCGDKGLLGDEEAGIIEPAIKSLIKNDINVSGPFPADSVFSRTLSGAYDAVVAMYHDQGLIAIKTLDFKHTVNITLGLPIIRTSVDHGTAEDIAWKGTADDTNLIAAIEMAVDMCKAAG